MERHCRDGFSSFSFVNQEEGPQSVDFYGPGFREGRTDVMGAALLGIVQVTEGFGWSRWGQVGSGPAPAEPRMGTGRAVVV